MSNIDAKTEANELFEVSWGGLLAMGALATLCLYFNQSATSKDLAQHAQDPCVKQQMHESRDKAQQLTKADLIFKRAFCQIPAENAKVNTGTS